MSYSLWRFLQSAGEDREERPVSLSESSVFTVEGIAPIGDAVAFIGEGGSADLALDIIARLATLHARALPD